MSNQKTDDRLKYTIEEIPGNRLTVDRRVQRTKRNEAKIAKLMRDWDWNLVGLLTVSRRDTGEEVLLDGDHRNEVIRRLTDNTGTSPCKVYEGLTRAQEADMFIKLNPGNQPTLMDRFRVETQIEESAAKRIEQIVHSRGWVADGMPGNGHINAVSVLYRLDDLSLKVEAEPHLVDVALLCITRAWGNDKHGVQAAILFAIGRMFSELGSRIDVDILINAMKNYKGGPMGLAAAARQEASNRGKKTSMTVADILTEAYNKGRSKNTLPPWRHRS